MPIEKLPEFAKDGQKNTDELDLETGFIVNRKPARQWFNWLFNTLALKINDVIDKKLDSDANAVSATKLATARIISFSGAATGSVNYDGSGNSSCILTLANSGVVANTYGSNLKIPTITVNAKGLITGVSEQQIPIVDDLTTGGSAKLLSAEQGKLLQANKLDKTALNNTLTSTSTTQALTAAQGKVLNDRFVNDFLNLKSKIGYQKLPSGLILQWGEVAVIANTRSTAQLVSLPISFTQILGYVGLSEDAGATSGAETCQLDIKLCTLSQIAVYSNYNGPAFFLAIGY